MFLVFFYLDYLVKKGQFLRIDLKFLLEGHSYSICDRRFGCIQKFFDTVERVELPLEWESLLKNSPLKNIEVHWATLNMIKDYKSWLRRQYISRSEDLNNEKFEVRRLAWLNFGYGEVADLEGKLELTHHPETVFIQFNIDSKEKPRMISFYKKKQMTELNSNLLEPARHEQRPVNNQVKKDFKNSAKIFIWTRASFLCLISLRRRLCRWWRLITFTIIFSAGDVRFILKQIHNTFLLSYWGRVWLFEYNGHSLSL